MSISMKQFMPENKKADLYWTYRLPTKLAVMNYLSL